MLNAISTGALGPGSNALPQRFQAFLRTQRFPASNR
jgi:hypothetical protein